MFAPVTPILVGSLREYVSDIECDIIYEMDKAFRAGAAKAKAYWDDH